MDDRNTAGSRSKRDRKPLDQQRLEALALAYVARYATSAFRLETYLRRKLRECPWDDPSEPDVSALVSRYVECGYVDDAGFARSRARDLLRRGYGARRVSQALAQAGIAQSVSDGMEMDEYRLRESALRLAQKRRFGPYATPCASGAGEQDPINHSIRQKHIAAMLRAGHNMEHILAVIDAGDIDSAEQWLAETREDYS